MSAIDFARSYMRWFGAVNNVRILVDAACTLTDDATGKSETYYLIAPCRAENTHGDTKLISHDLRYGQGTDTLLCPRRAWTG